MARPKGGYGKGIVGVTTVLNIWGANKGPLMYWAWAQGKDGKDFRETRDAAADAGTLAHSFIEAELKGEPLPSTDGIDPEVVSKAETSYIAWLDWAKLVDFQVVETEVSLVDQELKFGGTMDKVAIQNKLTLTDWKTSKGGVAYPEYWVQLAAYDHLWNLHFPDQIIHNYYLLILDKEQGGFSYHYKNNLVKHWDFFFHLLQAYHLYKEIK